MDGGDRPQVRTPEDELGVVDPIAIPGWDALRRSAAQLPFAGQVFLVLALLDLLARALNTGGLSLGIDLADATTIVTALLPHYPLILLPTIVLLGRPDAASATPLVFRGAVILSLVELLSAALLALMSEAGGFVAEDLLTPWLAVQIATAVATTTGYVLLGLGLTALIRSSPGPVIAGLANLVAGVLAASALSAVVVLLLQPPRYGLPEADVLLLLAATATEAVVVGLAFLGRAIVRGTADARRPAAATRLATAAVILATVDALGHLIANAVVLAGTFMPLPDPGAAGLGWLGTGLVFTLLAVAFGLGLADTSVRIPMGDWTDAEPDLAPEPVHWPAPGGDVSP